MTRTAAFWNGAIVGVGFIIGERGLHSDVLGLERWLEYTRVSWVNTSPWMWVVFLALTTVYATYVLNNAGRKDRVEP